jgi:hypothetical protein
LELVLGHLCIYLQIMFEISRNKSPGPAQCMYMPNLYKNELQC